MWPIEFIKWLIQYTLRGEPSLFERNIGSVQKSKMPKPVSSDIQDNSTLGMNLPQSVWTNTIFGQTKTKHKEIPSDKFVVNIELPRSSDHPRPRRYNIIMRKDIDVGKLRIKLAKEFNLNKDDWKVVAIDDKNRQYVLDDKKKLNEIRPEKRARLYFYPNILE
jgi:hypothetical protein